MRHTMCGLVTGFQSCALPILFVNIFFQGRFYPLFALLFGIGFALMLDRAIERGQPFVAVYLRRMLALALFGVLCMACTSGTATSFLPTQSAACCCWAGSGCCTGVGSNASTTRLRSCVSAWATSCCHSSS